VSKSEDTASTERIRVVLVDDHAALRSTIAMVLGTADDIDVVGEAGDGEEALRVCAATHPEVVLMDLRLPGMDGVSATRALQRQEPAPKVLVLTAGYEQQPIQEALAAGASGYVFKMGSIDEVIAAVRATRA
jgi:DNA-binding NarL/FixJ family response regulator